MVAKPVFKICFGGSYVNFCLQLSWFEVMFGAKLFPSRGQLFFFLQLQFSSISVVLFKTFILWLFITDFMFCMQLWLMLMLLCLLCFWWLVSAGLYVSSLLHPDCHKLFLNIYIHIYKGYIYVCVFISMHYCDQSNVMPYILYFVYNI